MNWAAISWLALMVLFLIIEANTVMLVSSWFAAGSLAALIVSMLGGPVWLQVVFFLAVSAVLLTLLRPLVCKHLTPKLVRTNVDSVIGSQGLVTVAIDNIAAAGQVKLGGMVWTARSTSGDGIPEGVQVKVDRIEGVKVFVTPVNVEAEVK